MGLVDNNVSKRRAVKLLVRARGRKIHIPGHKVALLDHHLRKDVLGTASLMGRYDVLKAKQVLHGLF